MVQICSKKNLNICSQMVKRCARKWSILSTFFRLNRAFKKGPTHMLKMVQNRQDLKSAQKWSQRWVQNCLPGFRRSNGQEAATLGYLAVVNHFSMTFDTVFPQNVQSNVRWPELKFFGYFPQKMGLYRFSPVSTIFHFLRFSSAYLCSTCSWIA